MFFWNIQINLLEHAYKLFISDVIDYATISLLCVLRITLVGFRFNGELGIWGNVIPHPLLLYLIDPFDWQGPDRAPSRHTNGPNVQFYQCDSWDFYTYDLQRVRKREEKTAS